MNLRILSISIVASAAVLGCGGNDNGSGADTGTTTSSGGLVPKKVYVANEDSETVSVIDESTLKVIATIDLAGHSSAMPMPHNVQAAPDGKSIWVTAPPMHEGGEEIVAIIDPETDTVAEALSLGTGLHLAHVVLDPLSSWAFVTANEGESLLRIDASKRTVDATWPLGAGRPPHGLRWCNGRLYVADMTANVLSVVDPESGDATEIDVGGLAVQTACVGDQWVFASLYDTREVVRYSLADATLTRIALPAEAQGPIQLYPTPDGKTLYVADQGILLDRPSSDLLFEVDVESATIRATIHVGAGAHGVVVEDDGKRAWVTNTEDASVSVVDIATREAVATIPVGDKPNGITCWHSDGGMP